MKRALGVGAAVLGFCALASRSAAADPKTPDKVATWLGVFQPTPADVTACKCDTADVLAHAGSVIVFVPGAAVGENLDVIVVQPLLGLAVRGRIAKSRVELAGFMLDRRANHDGVIVVAGSRAPIFVTPSAADTTSIRAVIAHADSLEGVKRAAAKLEIGAVDLDGDGTADLASTYGCKVWGDGACQVAGQFFLAHRTGKWFLIE